MALAFVHISYFWGWGVWMKNRSWSVQLHIFALVSDVGPAPFVRDWAHDTLENLDYGFWRLLWGTVQL